MSMASKCDVEIHFDKLPFIGNTKELATAGIIPGGTFNNLDYVKGDVNFGDYGRTQQLLLADAQTSGGLLVALPPNEADKYLEGLHLAGIEIACVVGRFIDGGVGKIYIR